VKLVLAAIVLDSRAIWICRVLLGKLIEYRPYLRYVLWPVLELLASIGASWYRPRGETPVRRRVLILLCDTRPVFATMKRPIKLAPSETGEE